MRFETPVKESRLPTIVFVHGDGRQESHAVPVGATVMDCAMDNGVAGIYAQCGGGCTCSTCHGFVARRWFALVGDAEGDERDILEFVPGRRRTSRLTCQIVVSEKLDGLVIHVPSEEPETTLPA